MQARPAASGHGTPSFEAPRPPEEPFPPEPYPEPPPPEEPYPPEPFPPAPGPEEPFPPEPTPEPTPPEAAETTGRWAAGPISAMLGKLPLAWAPRRARVDVWMGMSRPQRWAALAALVVLSGCGPQSGLSGAGNPAVGQSGTPIDLTDPAASKSRFLVWATQTVEPPPAVTTTSFGVAVAKAGPGGLAKALAGSECPRVDFLNFDPESSDPLPDPLMIELDYRTAALGLCVNGDEEFAGRVELTVRGAVALAGGELLPGPGADLVVTETYPQWTHKVTQPSGDVIAYSFGGSRALRVDGTGAVNVAADPLVTRRAVQTAANGLKLDERSYQVSNQSVTRTPVPSVDGVSTAWREDGGMRVASSLDGYADVVLSGVLRDPAVCGGAPTGGSMRFQNGGPAVIVNFDADYLGNPGAFCGRAHVLRPGFGEPQLEVFDATPPVL